MWGEFLELVGWELSGLLGGSRAHAVSALRGLSVHENGALRWWQGRGAGRPNRTGTEGHTRREPVNFKKPLHLTLKLRKLKLKLNLRSREILKVVQTAARSA